MWRRGFIRERNQFAKVLEFVWAMDLADPFLCTVAFPTVLKILSYGVQQLLLLDELEPEPEEGGVGDTSAALTNLLNMGFERDQSLEMLQRTGNDVGAAAQHLLDNTIPVANGNHFDTSDSDATSDSDDEQGRLRR